jgi:glycosyltransferase involved in cell wall biosynthesis
MRILHVHSGNLYGGVETLLATLARYRELCPSVNHEFALCFQGRIGQELASIGTTVHHLGAVRIRHPMSVYRARKRLRHILEDGGFDLMVCHMAWAYGVFAAVGRRAGTPVLLWLHDAFGAHNWIGWWIGRQKPRAIIANSHFTKSSWDSVFPGAPVSIIRYPVARPRPAVGFSRHIIRERLGADDDAVALVQASRMQPWKGHSTLLSALALLKERTDWVCWIVGGAQRPAEHHYMASLRKQVADLGISKRIRFTGERRDVADLLAAADICCQANAEPEPFGISFIEAMYSGLPVITSAFGGAVEIVTPDCGMLAAPNSAESFADTLESLLDDKRRLAELAAGARKRAARLCDPAMQMEWLSRSFAEALGIAPTPAARHRADVLTS